MFKQVRGLGVATSLDMTLPDANSPAGQADWGIILANTLPLVDIFMPSIEEILFMLEPDQYACLLAGANGRDMVDVIPREIYDGLADRILEMGVTVLMIKAGHRGAYLRTGDVAKLNSTSALRLPAADWSHRKSWCEPFPVAPRRFKNACGAGDCAAAAFLTAMLEGVEIGKAARYAMLAGRDNLHGHDAYSGLTDWAAMTRMVGRSKGGGRQ